MQKSSRLQKIIAVTFLPIIISFWITGWTLTKIGKPEKPTEPNQKILKKNHKLAPQATDSETPDENIEIDNKPLIAM